MDGTVRIARYKSHKNKITYLIFGEDERLKGKSVILSINDEKIVVQRMPLDWSGKSQILSEHNNTVAYAHGRNEIPTGRYLIDEDESDDDKYVVYLEDKIDEKNV